MSSFHNIDPKEYTKLKMRISELEKKVEFLLTNLQLKYVSTEDDEYNDLKKMASEGNVFEAMKLYRQRTKASMEDARKFFGVE